MYTVKSLVEKKATINLTNKDGVSRLIFLISVGVIYSLILRYLRRCPVSTIHKCKIIISVEMWYL